MNLVDLHTGGQVFLDASIFIYHFGGQSLECKVLLERCARRELMGYTSASILAEVLHRRMVAEAIGQGLVTPKTAVRRLGEAPDMVKRLSQYQEDVSKIPQMHITILPLTLGIVHASADVRRSEGLLYERFTSCGLHAGTGAYSTGDGKRRLRQGDWYTNLQTG